MPGDTDHAVDGSEVMPHHTLEVPHPDEDVPHPDEIVWDDAKMEKVMDAVDTVAVNGDYDEYKLTQFGRRMSSLIYHGGMKPSAAKAKAANELFGKATGLSTQGLADLLDMTRGGMSKLLTNGAVTTADAERLRFMTFNVPCNIMVDETLSAEGPADYETRYVIVEVVDPQLQDEEYMDYNWDGPDPKVAPQEPQYGVIEEAYSYHKFMEKESPSDRTFGPFSDLQISWYMDETELVDELYEGEYFQTEERATLWKTLLERTGFTVQSEPRERIHPDFLESEV